MTDGRNEEIALRAYSIWQKEGCPEGQAEWHWLKAEKELLEKAVDVSTVNAPIVEKSVPAKAA